MKHASFGLLVILLSACSSSAPIEVQVGDHPMNRNQIVRMTAMENDTVIESVKFNEGACIGSTSLGLPYTLQMGQELQLVTNCLNMVKVEVTTNSGDFEFSF